ncbi:MAG: hypothetical protein AAFR88_03495 [Pseudomonadota bacterium]
MDEQISGHLLDTDIVVALAFADGHERTRLADVINPDRVPWRAFVVCSTSSTEYASRKGVGRRKVIQLQDLLKSIKSGSDKLLSGTRFIMNGRGYVEATDQVLEDLGEVAYSLRAPYHVAMLLGVARKEGLGIITQDRSLPTGVVPVRLIDALAPQ